MSKFLSLKEVAERLNISNNLAWRLAKSKKIKAIKVSRAYRISEEDLEEFIKKSAYSS